MIFLQTLFVLEWLFMVFIKLSYCSKSVRKNPTETKWIHIGRLPKIWRWFCCLQFSDSRAETSMCGQNKNHNMFDSSSKFFHDFRTFESFFLVFELENSNKTRMIFASSFVWFNILSLIWWNCTIVQRLEEISRWSFFFIDKRWLTLYESVVKV